MKFQDRVREQLKHLGLLLERLGPGAVAVVAFLLILFVGSLISPSFLTERNIFNVLRQTCMLGVVSVGIQIRPLGRQLHGPHTTSLQNVGELSRVKGVSVVDQIPGLLEEPIDDIGQIAGNLLHPVSVRLLNDTCNLDAPGLEVDHEEYEVAHQASLDLNASLIDRTNLSA